MKDKDRRLPFDRRPWAKEPARSLYFAYGSNLDAEQMGKRCPQAQLVGPAVIPGYRFAFKGRWSGAGTGVATLILGQRARTHGLLYLCTDRDLVALDKCEGVPHVYKPVSVQVHRPSGRTLTARTYLMPEGNPAGLPLASYFAKILRCYRDLGFRSDCLNRAMVEAAEAVEAVARWEREERKAAPPTKSHLPAPPREGSTYRDDRGRVWVHTSEAWELIGEGPEMEDEETEETA